MTSFEIGDRVQIIRSEINLLIGLCGTVVRKGNNTGACAVLIDGYDAIRNINKSNMDGRQVKVFDGPYPGTRWFSYDRLCHDEAYDQIVEESELLQIIGV